MNPIAPFSWACKIATSAAKVDRKAKILPIALFMSIVTSETIGLSKAILFEFAKHYWVSLNLADRATYVQNEFQQRLI